MPRTGEHIQTEDRVVVVRGYGRGNVERPFDGRGVSMQGDGKVLAQHGELLTATELYTSKMVKTVNMTSIDLLAQSACFLSFNKD